MFAQACCRHRKVKGTAGASQSGKIVKVLWHGRQIPRRTQMRSFIVCLTEPLSLTDDRLVTANRTLVSAIKRITAGVKAAGDRSLPSFRSAGRAVTLR